MNYPRRSTDRGKMGIGISDGMMKDWEWTYSGKKSKIPPQFSSFQRESSSDVFSPSLSMRYLSERILIPRSCAVRCLEPWAIRMALNT